MTKNHFIFLIALIVSVGLYYANPNLKSLSYFAFPIMFISFLVRDSVDKLTYNLIYFGCLIIGLLLIGIAQGIIKIA